MARGENRARDKQRRFGAGAIETETNRSGKVFCVTMGVAARDRAQPLDRHGASALKLSKDERRGNGRKGVNHGARVLVGGDGKDDNSARKLLGEPLRARRVVGDINDDRRIVQDPLQTAWPFRGPQSLGDRALRDARKSGAQPLQRGRRNRRILALETPGKTQWDRLDPQSGALVAKRLGKRRTGHAAIEIPTDRLDRGAAFSGAAQDDAARSGFAFSHDKRNPGLDNAGFFEGDFFKRVAKILKMVKIDGGDDGLNGRDYVGRIKTPAHAHFDHRDIDLADIKPAERDCGEQLNIRRRMAKPLGDIAKKGDMRVQFFRANGLPINQKTLGNVDKMRARVPACSVPRRAQRRAQKRRDASLAVCSGDVHMQPPAFGASSRRQQKTDVLEPELDAVEFKPGEILAGRHCGVKYRRSLPSKGRNSERLTI